MCAKHGAVWNLQFAQTTWEVPLSNFDFQPSRNRVHEQLCLFSSLEVLDVHSAFLARQVRECSADARSSILCLHCSKLNRWKKLLDLRASLVFSWLSTTTVWIQTRKRKFQINSWGWGELHKKLFYVDTSGQLCSPLAKGKHFLLDWGREREKKKSSTRVIYRSLLRSWIAARF